MSWPYLEDLYERGVAAVAGGSSRRQAAEVFDMGVSSVTNLSYLTANATVIESSSTFQ